MFRELKREPRWEPSTFCWIIRITIYRGGSTSKKSGYPKLSAHHLEHEKFKKAVEDLRVMLEEEEGPSEAFVDAVRKNVEEWLWNHIMTWDKEVAGYAETQAEI